MKYINKCKDNVDLLVESYRQKWTLWLRKILTNGGCKRRKKPDNYLTRWNQSKFMMHAKKLANKPFLNVPYDKSWHTIKRYQSQKCISDFSAHIDLLIEKIECIKLDTFNSLTTKNHCCTEGCKTKEIDVNVGPIPTLQDFILYLVGWTESNYKDTIYKYFSALFKRIGPIIENKFRAFQAKTEGALTRQAIWFLLTVFKHMPAPLYAAMLITACVDNACLYCQKTPDSTQPLNKFWPEDLDISGMSTDLYDGSTLIIPLTQHDMHICGEILVLIRATFQQIQGGGLELHFNNKGKYLHIIWPPGTTFPLSNYDHLISNTVYESFESEIARP